MRMPRPWVPVSHLNRRATVLALLIVAATGLELAAGTGLGYVAGFSEVFATLRKFDGIWLLAVMGALVVSFTGYYYAYRGIFQAEGGPTLSARQMRAVVAAGFGGHLAHGGGTLDMYALRAAGADECEAKIRAAGLAGLEQGVLAIGGCGAAITVLVTGLSQPDPAYTLPWAIAPVPGFIIAFWLAERYRGRFRSKPGWRGRLGTFLGSIHIIRVLFTHPLRWGPAVWGMALFWAADAFAAWAGLAAFGYHLNPAALVIGFATGMVFTRRTGPLAGAGVLALLLPLTIWASGAPFAVAVVGVFAYRLLALWLPTPVSFAVLPTLRKLGQPRPLPPLEPTGGSGAPDPEPAVPVRPASPGPAGKAGAPAAPGQAESAEAAVP